MDLRYKKLSEITEVDLQSLLKDKAPESRYIEYKSKLPGRTDGDKKEFLADISSFANTDGGDIIYGISEDEGIPIEICGLQAGNQDEQIRFLENLLRNGVEPHIPGVQFHTINLSGEKGWALVIRFPRAGAPHIWLPCNCRAMSGSSGEIQEEDMLLIITRFETVSLSLGKI